VIILAREQRKCVDTFCWYAIGFFIFEKYKYVTVYFSIQVLERFFYSISVRRE
jgi:hypothetical protein